MTADGVFVGVGVSSYDELQPLPAATKELRALHELVADSLIGEPLVDPVAAEVWAHLAALPAPETGTLVVYWSGHAVVGGGDLRLMTRDSSSDPRSGLSAKEVIFQAVRAGVTQLLIIVDTCFADEAANDLDDIAGVLVEEAVDAARIWVGVLASCQSYETAQDGAFGEFLLDVVRNGPSDAALRRGWSVHNQWLQGDDLGNAQLSEAAGRLGQRPSFRRLGLSGPVLPNPRHQAAARPQIVEHLLLAARGGGDTGRSWFTGRREEVDAVVGWITSHEPGVRVVTGSAGTGKSAITGRVVSVATPGERALLLEQGELGHLDPGEGAVDAHAHLRGLTADQVAEDLDRQLVACGVLAAPTRKRSAVQLVAALEQIDSADPPVLVLDGLDEARDHAFAIARDLLAPLGRSAIVVVSTRNRPGEDAVGAAAHEPRTAAAHTVVGGDGSLVGALHPETVLDLDEPRSLESGRLARFEYVRKRLSARPVDPGADLVMDAHAVAQLAVEEAAGDEPFLVARLLVDQLLSRPVDTRQPDWRERARTSIDDALQTAIGELAPPAHRDLPDGLTAAAFGRAVLGALTWGLGAGLPEPEWAAVATGLVQDLCDRAGTGTTAAVDAGDITWVLTHLGRFVVEDGESGVAVYRMAHQSLADHLRSPFHPSPELTFDPQAVPVAEALTGRYRALLEAAVPADGAAYLFRYAWFHAGLAGPAGVAAMTPLAEIDPALRYDVGLTAEMAAGQLADQECYPEAVRVYETATDYLRGLDLTVTVHAHHLGESLGNLGRCHWQLDDNASALAATQEAATIFRELADRDQAYRMQAALSAFNLAIFLGALDRQEEAVAAAYEAAFRYHELAETDNDAVQDLADALTHLAQRLDVVERGAQALSVRRRLRYTLAHLAAADPARRAELASLDARIGTDESSSWQEGRESLGSAIATYRELAAEGVDVRYELAQALYSLATVLGAHDADAANASAAESASLVRELLPQQPDLRGQLCLTCGQLADGLRSAGRPEESVAAAREALGLLPQLDPSEPAPVDEAELLWHLGHALADLGRTDEACTSARRLIDILDAPEPEQQNKAGLGLALAALARWSEQHSEESVAHATRAIEVLLEARQQDPDVIADIVGAWRLVQNAVAAHPTDGVVADRADALWDRLTAVLGEGELARARGYRADEESDVATAVALLVPALDPLEAGGPDRRVDWLRARDELRSRFAADPTAAEAGWRAAGVPDPPQWARLAVEDVAAARVWATAPTHREERETLRDQPRLLAPDQDAAAEESLLSINFEMRGVLRELRLQARELGPDLAYRSVMVREVAHALTEAGLIEMRDLLTTETVDLPAVRELLLGYETGEFAREADVVALAATPEGAAMIVRLADAAETGPGGIEELLWSMAGTDVPQLAAHADALALLAVPGPNLGIALMFRAVARQLGEPAAGTITWPVASDVDAALREHPDLRLYWISDLTVRVREHPQLVGIVARLTGLSG